MHREGKLPADPLAGIKCPNADADRRHERRALSPDEWRWLDSATRSEPCRYGMEGSQRALLYRVAIETGLRANELRSLTRASLWLDDAAPCIVVKARSTKNKRDARQGIHPTCVALLREHVVRKAPNAPVFDLPREWDMVDMVRADVAGARRAWLKEAADDPDERLRREASDFLAERNHEGLVFDFHSLRHTCGALLALAGIPPKVVQTVMRHSTINLTMDTYGHLFPGQLSEAVARMGEILAGGPTNETTQPQRATGTMDDRPPSVQRAGGGPGRDMASRGAMDAKSDPDASRTDRRTLAASGESRREKAKVSLSGLEPETYGLKVRCSTN